LWFSMTVAILELTSGSYSYTMNRTREGKSVDHLVLACEPSPLGLASARTIVEQLEILHPRLDVEVRPVRGSASGRRGGRSGNPLLRALEKDSADAVIVSAEALPDDLPPGLEIAVVAERLVPFHALVTTFGILLDEIPEGARISVPDDLTRFQLAGHRSDLHPVPARQSLGASLQRVRRGQSGGLIAPVLELELLGWQDIVAEVLDGSIFLPRPGR
jgi:porphobilinogen deaminase